LKKQALFLVKFFAIFFVLQAIILFLSLNFLEQSLASFEAGLLGLQVNGNTVFVNGNSFSVDANCTGLLSVAILAAIVFSLRKPKLEKKFLVFFVSGALLLLLNVPRLFFVLWAAKEYGVSVAEAVHELSWFSTGIFILFFWFFATRKIAKIKDFSQLL
jgi:exosortase/archaeosortase family protein